MQKAPPAGATRRHAWARPARTIHTPDSRQEAGRCLRPDPRKPGPKCGQHADAECLGDLRLSISNRVSGIGPPRVASVYRSIFSTFLSIPNSEHNYRKGRLSTRTNKGRHRRRLGPCLTKPSVVIAALCCRNHLRPRRPFPCSCCIYAMFCMPGMFAYG